jgi:hypothetical protein
MAAGDATWNPKKNVAYRVTFPILDADGDLVSGATGLDSEVSKDAGTFTDCTNEATEIATSSGVYYLDLTATEMNADTVAIIVKTTSSGAKTTVLVFFPLETTDTPVDVLAISGDTVAADNLEAAADGTGYNLGGGSIVAASVTAAVTANTTQLAGQTVAAASAVTFPSSVASPTNITQATGIVLAATTHTGAVIPWNAAWDAEVQSEVQDAIEVNHLDHILAVTYDPASPVGVADSLFNDLVEDNGAGTTRFTTTALEQAPSGGGGGGTDWTTDERTAIRAILGIPTSGATPADPTTGILDTIRDAVLTVDTVADRIEVDTQDIQGRLPAALVSGRMDASVGAMAANVLTASALATDAVGEIADGVWDEAMSGHTTAGTYGGRIPRSDTSNVEVKITGSGHTAADIHELQAAVIDNTHFAAGAIDSNAVAASAASEIATAVYTGQMTEAYRAAGVAPTLAQAMFELVAHMGDSSISGTTKTLKKIDGTTAKTFTLDSSTAPTSITEAT